MLKICHRYEHDLERFHGPNLIKQATHAAFWIKKLKPIQSIGDTPLYANEVLAFACAHALIAVRYEPRVPIDATIMNEIFHAMRYRFVSPQSAGFTFNIMYRRKQRD